MLEFNVKQSVGEIVSIMPKASEIFKSLGIDFCCGGHRPLSVAISEQNLYEDKVLMTLQKAFEETKELTDIVDYRKLSSSQLIDYIVNTHHVFVKKILPELSDLITKILKVHGINHNDLFTVHKLFHNLKTELDQHLIKEEELLFPLIKEYKDHQSESQYQQVKKVMEETEDEHDGAGDILKELRRITNNYQVPQDGCGTYELAYEKLQALESDLFEHIHLENNILFKGF